MTGGCPTPPSTRPQARPRPGHDRIPGVHQQVRGVLAVSGHGHGQVRLLEGGGDGLRAIHRHQGADTDPEIGKVSIVGAGMRSHPGVAAKVFQILADAEINIEMISTSPIKISCVIRAEAVPQAVRALHSAFELGAAAALAADDHQAPVDGQRGQVPGQVARAHDIQDDVGARIDRRSNLVEGVAFDFDFDPGRSDRSRTTHCQRDIAIDRCQMVVLDQHRRREIHSVIQTSARADRVLFEASQQGSRLPCVENVRPRSRYRLDVARCQRRNAGQTLQEVECDALCRQQSMRVPRQKHHGRFRADSSSIFMLYSNGDRRVELLERFARESQSSDHPCLSRYEPAPGPPVRKHDCGGGDVVLGVICLQRLRNQRGQLFFCKREVETFFPEESVTG